MSVMVNFWMPREDKEGPTFGPFEFVQLTYEDLRYGPDGEVLAFILEEGDWEIVSGPHSGEVYSDVVVYTEGEG